MEPTLTPPSASLWRNRIVGDGVAPAGSFLANENNWRLHPLAQRKALAGVLAEIGWVDRVLVNKRTHPDWGSLQNIETLVDGHARVEEALGISEEEPVPFEYVDLTPKEERLVLATLDPLSALAVADKDKLGELLRSIPAEAEQIRGLLETIARQGGIGLADAVEQQARLTLAERFGVPPFSVLDARQGYWQERKRAWLALGIQSELGRGEGVTCAPSDAMRDETLNYYRKQNGLLGFSEQARSHYAIPGGPRGLARKSGQDLMRGEHVVGEPPKGISGRRPGGGYTIDADAYSGGDTEAQSGTSVFDPVLCELAYRWFCPPGGLVLDPFAGGSVRGIVAAVLGRRYVGVDLSERQIAANEMQAASIVPDFLPRWVMGDSQAVAALAPGQYDFVFTCPPYADLEVYSDDPRDLSTMSYPDFLTVYRRIIAASLTMLKRDRFAAICVGDVRDAKGFYRNFVSDTIAAFQDAGARLYNEAILVTAVGSLPIRVGRQFQAGRKLGKTHQNVLVFVKGDPRKATEAIGPVEVGTVVEDDALAL